MEKEKNIKILFIEDDKDLTEVYYQAFKAKGYNILLANNGKQGLSKILKQKPDLILLDLLMPEMDGFDLLKTLKKTRKNGKSELGFFNL